MSNIYYLDAAAGAGKTYAMARYVEENVKAGKNFLIVMPTNKMCSDIELEIKNLNSNIIVTAYHGDVISGAVTKEVYRHLNESLDVNQVVVITAPCFLLLNHVNRSKEWHLIIDEVPSVFKMFDPNLPINHRSFSDLVEPFCVGPSQGYSNLHVLNPAKLRKLADNIKNDDVDKVFQPLARVVQSDDYQVYVLDSNYQNLLDNKSSTSRLLLFSVLRPTVVLKFASTLIIAAQFKETLLSKIWTRMNVTFIEHLELKEKLRFTDHSNGSLIKFYYGFDAMWSKSLKDNRENDTAERLIASALDLVGSRNCLLLRNKNCQKSKYLTKIDQFINLPGKSHGQNQYQGYDHTLVLAAYNLQTPALNFLKIMFGIDEESAKRSIMSYEIYQAVMRSSIRNLESTTEKIVIVPDRATAEWLSSLFPGSSCESLGLDQPVPVKRGPKAVHASSSERKRISREKLKAERIGLIEEIKLAPQDNLRDLSDIERDEFTLESIGNYVPLVRGTIITNMKDRNTNKRLIISDQGPFIAFLRDRSKKRFANKEDNEVISPAVFRDLDDFSSKIAGKNVVFANGIWLDLDKTDLNPSKFAIIFPNLTFVAYNTFSHTKLCNRLRIYIPTSEIMLNYQYKNIIKQIIYKVEATGRYVKKHDRNTITGKVHGIDTKYDASNKFYLPCKPGNGGPGLFRVFDCPGRLPLDVDDWLENPIIPIDYGEYQHLIESTDNDNYGKLTPFQIRCGDKALDKFLLAQKGEGHLMFFKLHLRLFHLGFRGPDWYAVMAQAVACSRSPLERQKEMNEFVKKYNV